MGPVAIMEPIMESQESIRKFPPLPSYEGMYGSKGTPGRSGDGSPGDAPEATVRRNAGTANTWLTRRVSNRKVDTASVRRIGVDAGSKTLKLVALDEQGGVVFALYHRHRSDVRNSFADMLHEALWHYGDLSVPVAVTGSAGIALAEQLGLPFVQEVVATTNAVRSRHPETDCIIELGGEDAKITYLSGNVEQRMNATCAGGTGDFIDGIASMLGLKTREISNVALGSQHTYPIASRCAVFAQTDVRPLINAGARKADIAQSALEAVVRQTLGGLACGRSIRGNVVFLGGPLEHIPALVIAFRHALGLNKSTGLKPADAHLYAAMGACETAVNAPAVALSSLEKHAREIEGHPVEGFVLSPLFENGEEHAAFVAAHAASPLPRTWLDDAEGPLFLGFDAGSTTMKYALIDAEGALLLSDYREVEGDTFATAREMMEGLLRHVEGESYSRVSHFLAHATVTGYGEDLLRVGFGFDSGVVETVAHLRAAQHMCPDVSFLLDIGGQDMKALWVQDGMVVDAVLNEACSSGCGAFVQSCAKSMELTNEEFAKRALSAAHPIDLGAKCTVFMTSRVRQAQKAGAEAGDIAAGIAYSIVKNVMDRIIGRGHSRSIGSAVVVQGGTFKSDAVLRAFELATGVVAMRPESAHLMGAYGAALVARERWLGQRDRLHVAGGIGDVQSFKQSSRAFARCGTRLVDTADSARLRGESSLVDGPRSTLLNAERVHALDPKRATARCTGCGNNCLLSIVDFGDGRHFISGNRCERAYSVMFDEPGPEDDAPSAPNVVALEQKLIASLDDIEAQGERGAFTVGLMGALNVYGSKPFWHQMFASLGFSVVVPNDDAALHLRGKAAETVPSESVCHPAKLAHLRYAYLVERGADVVFMPRFQRGTRCPVATQYVDALADNVGWERLLVPTFASIRPRKLVKRPEDCSSLLVALNGWLPPEYAVGKSELDAALADALAAQEAYERTIATAVEKARRWTAADPARRMAVLAGRAYHADPAVLHGIDRELKRLGFAVVSAEALKCADRAQAEGADVPGDAVSAKATWKPAKHLVQLVGKCAADDQVEVVALRSFGCGFDAVSCEEAHDVAQALHRPFTELKIDDVADLAHVRIRLRTLAFTSQHHLPPAGKDVGDQFSQARGTTVEPTPDLCSTAKKLVAHAAAQLVACTVPEVIQVPTTCLDCLTDALPFELRHLCEPLPPVEKRAPQVPEAHNTDGRMKVGLLGNPLLVFDARANDGIVDLLESLGCQVVYPQPRLIEVEDVRYRDQLEEFECAGVQRVIYLQSFGCLKGHVQSRGALHELARQFPSLPITVIDFDADASALSRENRVRLAVAQATGDRY